MPPRPISELCNRLGLKREPPFLVRALAHGSAKETGAQLATNDTLAFLGDAVLELAIRRRGWKPDELTKLGELSIKADELARNTALAKLAKAACLDLYIHAGPTDGARQDSVFASALADTLRAGIIAEGYVEGEGRARVIMKA